MGDQKTKSLMLDFSFQNRYNYSHIHGDYRITVITPVCGTGNSGSIPGSRPSARNVRLHAGFSCTRIATTGNRTELCRRRRKAESMAFKENNFYIAVRLKLFGWKGFPVVAQIGQLSTRKRLGCCRLERLPGIERWRSRSQPTGRRLWPSRVQRSYEQSELEKAGRFSLVVPKKISSIYEDTHTDFSSDISYL